MQLRGSLAILVRDVEGATPLCWVSRRSSLDIDLRVLLSHGEDLRALVPVADLGQ